MNFERAAASQALLEPDDVAEQYVALHRQPRSAWTHELDLRPWQEPLWFAGRAVQEGRAGAPALATRQ